MCPFVSSNNNINYKLSGVPDAVVNFLVEHTLSPPRSSVSSMIDCYIPHTLNPVESPALNITLSFIHSVILWDMITMKYTKSYKGM